MWASRHKQHHHMTWMGNTSGAICNTPPKSWALKWRGNQHVHIPSGMTGLGNGMGANMLIPPPHMKELEMA